MVLYHFDFVNDAAILNLRGKDRLLYIASLMTHYQFPIVIERTPWNPHLAEARRQVVITELSQQAIPFSPEQIVIDPGHDLNKNTFHTLELTRRLPEIAAVGYPMLAAVSNKDFVGETLNRPQGERLSGSLAAAVTSVLLGARIVRMHNVRESVDAVHMTEAILGWRQPAYTVHNM